MTIITLSDGTMINVEMTARYDMNEEAGEMVLILLEQNRFLRSRVSELESQLAQATVTVPTKRKRYFEVKPGTYSRSPQGIAKLSNMYQGCYVLEWSCGHKDLFAGSQIKEVFVSKENTND